MLVGTARLYDTTDAVRLLLEAPDVDVNAKGFGGDSALIAAAGGSTRGHTDNVWLLLAEPDVDVNAKNNVRSAVDALRDHRRPFGADAHTCVAPKASVAPTCVVRACRLSPTPPDTPAPLAGREYGTHCRCTQWQHGHRGAPAGGARHRRQRNK